MTPYEKRMQKRLAGDNSVQSKVTNWGDNALFSGWVLVFSVVVNMFASIDYTMRSVFGFNLVSWVKNLFKDDKGVENENK